MEIKQVTITNFMCLRQAGLILIESLNIGYPTFKDTLKEARKCAKKGITTAAIENRNGVRWGCLLGPYYSGNVYELHPLAVEQSKRGKGI